MVAYSRVDGLVEALLLQNGIISQVYRDPTVVGGWNIREIATGALDMVAGLNAGSSFREYQLHLFYRSTSGQMHHLLEGRLPTQMASRAATSTSRTASTGALAGSSGCPRTSTRSCSRSAWRRRARLGRRTPPSTTTTSRPATASASTTVLRET